MALALAVIGLIVVAALAGTISAFFVETSPTGSIEAGPEPAPIVDPSIRPDDSEIRDGRQPGSPTGVRPPLNVVA